MKNIFRARQSPKKSDQADPYIDFTGESLSDMIKAIQFLSTCTDDKKIAEITTKLKSPRSKKSWKDFFELYPEFFVVNEGGGEDWVVLTLRYYTDRTKALTPSDAGMLMGYALDIHDRAIAHRQEKRWFWEKILPTILPMLTGIVVGVLAFWGGIKSAEIKNTPASAASVAVAPAKIEIQYPGAIEYNVPTTNGTIYLKDAQGKKILKMSVQKGGDITISQP